MIGKAILKHKSIDAAVIGEGEYTMLELVEKVEERERPANIKGVIYRKEGRIIENPPRNYIKNLDEIPFPAQNLLPMDLYGEYKGAIITSRGCPYSCTFCSKPVFGKTWRAHSPSYVLREKEELITKYKAEQISFLDDEFLLDRKRAEAILDGIIERRWKVKLYFWNGLRVDEVDEKILMKMKQAGCTTINYGVESVDPLVLKNIKKNITLTQIEKAVKIARKLGIKVNLFLMIGNPGDTYEHVEKIKRFLDKVEVDGVHLSMATPYIKTEF
ncbi:MAG: hypothetical protein DRJ26_05535 [Candidatus Methanomethylicota archaeon]|uniref:Radical SAM core domain-containing protein n=1 Tax=Thermoproteota archaeon TaxID=2056631 RepID=A0A497EWA4_9CREN|nr:MAG: hypothetical protein DRJ26_05535 [Candidatus Verstraetearchaeota archaeon]